jgi:DNA invertase Pin-like site-specific DNA recombinase
MNTKIKSSAEILIESMSLAIAMFEHRIRSEQIKRGLSAKKVHGGEGVPTKKR